jgi:predicted acetyltransferase
MDIALIAAPVSAEPLLDRLMQLYAYDFSEILGADIGEDGRFAAGTALAGCWTDPRRHPFVLRADGQIAGFAILEERSRLTGDLDVADVAEFFVLRRFRRLGVGTAAAARAFDLFPRRWEVRQRSANTAATAFWRRAIASYTGGAFIETVLDDARWRGPVQSFDVATRRAGPSGA